MKYQKANIYRLIAVFSIFIIQFSILNAQDTWIQTYQPFGDVNYYPEDIVICQDGGYAVNGHYDYYDMFYEKWGFLMKTDSLGNLLWGDLDTLDFMDENESLAFVETSDGSFISACSGGVLIKRNSEGSIEWVIDEDFGVNSMDITTDGNIILGGTQNLNIGLRKIDEEGNTLWTQVYQIDDDYSICKSIIQTQDGGYALTGYLDHQGRPDADILVMKTDANGDSLWTRTYDGYGNWDQGNCVTEVNNENIIIAGQVDTPSLEAIIWMIDNQGNTVWFEEILNSYHHWSVLSIDNNSHVAFCTTEDGPQIYNFDNNFIINWFNVFSGWNAYGDKSFRSISGLAYVCALNDVGGNHTNNIGIVKTDSQGQVDVNDEDLITDINEITLSNYPNPFNTLTNIQYDLPTNIEKANLEIFNIKGQKIKQLLVIRNLSSVEWNGKDKNNNTVSSGIYLYRLIFENYISRSKKLILTK